LRRKKKRRRTKRDRSSKKYVTGVLNAVCEFLAKLTCGWFAVSVGVPWKKMIN
jgi:hypothetical protein